LREHRSHVAFRYHHGFRHSLQKMLFHFRVSHAAAAAAAAGQIQDAQSALADYLYCHDAILLGYLFGQLPALLFGVAAIFLVPIGNPKA
jgi:hypothetical protein